ncbi:MAG: DUF4132 domain-containing protein [Myxococcales bacterium]
MTALPSVLAAGPWVPARPRAVLSLTPIERETIHWQPGEKEKLLSPHVDDPSPGELEARRQQERETFLRGGIIPMGTGRHLEVDDLAALAKAGLRLDFVLHYGLLLPPLARHGEAALPAMLELYATWPFAVRRDVLFRTDSTRIARFLMEKGEDETWGQYFPETSGLVLLPAALGPDGDVRKKALKSLKALRKNGYAAQLRAAAEQYGSAAVEEYEALFAPPPLPPKAPKLPAFVQPDQLPALALRDGALVPADAALRLLQLASLLPLECARAAIDSATPALDPQKLSDLADAVLRAWLAVEAPTKEKWVLYATALFGDERAVRALANHVVEWHEAKLSARAKLALKAIAANGSDVALMHLSFLTRKKSSLGKAAKAELEAYREEQELTEDALADRLVPDLGLDANGTMVFDYGARSFRAGFDQDLLPFVVDQGGGRAASLPRPSKTDDAEKAVKARELWDALKKETKGLAAEQLRRLERAMVARREWDRAQFDRYFLKHPLMQHVARRLIWGVVDRARGQATTGFRVAEDGTFAGEDDSPFTLPADARVVVWHALDMPEQTKARFSQLLSDYVVIQPFPQLSRELFTPTDEEQRASKTARWKGAKARGERFFTLKHRGWRFMDYDMSKPVIASAEPKAAIEAMLTSEPGLYFLASKPEDQTLGELTLRDAAGKERTFGELTPISASELFRDVELLLR